MDRGTRSTIARALVAGVLAVGLSVGVAAAPAAAAPGSIADAQRTADELEARIGELNQTLADAQAAADAAHAASAIALDDYQATQAAYQAAQQRAEVAAADAAAATAALGVAREDVVAFARRSYMQGSTYPEVAALLTAADPSQLIERAALLEAAGSHRSDVLDTVTVLQEQAARADVVARTAVVEADQLQADAAAALEVAQAAEVSARDQAATVAAEQAGLETELAAVQEELRDLVGAKEAAERAAAVTPPPAAPPAGPPPASSGDDTPAGPGSSSAAQTAIDAAVRYLGTPYAWGGGGRNGPGPGLAPDEGVIGFDCSGLTQYAYAQAGISIPRNSRAQYAALPKVSADDLQPGDLVFWASNPGNPATIYHVAIYLGNGRIVQAPESGDVVKVSNMWWAGYAGAVRPSA